MYSYFELHNGGPQAGGKMLSRALLIYEKHRQSQTLCLIPDGDAQSSLSQSARLTPLAQPQATCGLRRPCEHAEADSFTYFDPFEHL